MAWSEGLRVTCTSHFLEPLDLLSLIWKLDRAFKVNEQLCVNFHLTCKELLEHLVSVVNWSFPVIYSKLSLSISDCIAVMYVYPFSVCTKPDIGTVPKAYLGKTEGLGVLRGRCLTLVSVTNSNCPKCASTNNKPTEVIFLCFQTLEVMNAFAIEDILTCLF